MNAIIKKELRDLIRWIPLGIVFGVVMVWMVLPTQFSTAASFDVTFHSQLALFAAVVATAFGLLQSLFDIRNDKRGYLLHRPLSHQQVFWAKLIAGFIAYVGTLAIPVCVAAVYLSFHGIDRLPCNAWQLLPACISCLFVFLFHPTAILIANRKARWLGTRVLPAVGTMLGVFFLHILVMKGFGVSEGLAETLSGRMLGLGVIAIPLAALVVLAAGHAFSSESRRMPARGRGVGNISGIVLLLFSAVGLYTTAAVLFLSSFPATLPSSYSGYRLDISPENEMRILRTTQNFPYGDDPEYATKPINSKGPFESGTVVPANTASLHEYWVDANPFKQFKVFNAFPSKSSSTGQVDVVEFDRRLLLYSNNRLEGIVTPDGVFRDLAKVTGQFDGRVASTYLGSTNNVFQDSSGIYQIDFDDFSIRQLVKGKFDRINPVFSPDGKTSTVWTLADDQLTRFDLQPFNTSDTSPGPGHVMIDGVTVQAQSPPVEFVKRATYEIEPEEFYESIYVLHAPDDTWVLAKQSRRQTRQQSIQYRNLDKSKRGEYAHASLVIDLSIEKVDSDDSHWYALCIPPFAMGGALLSFGNSVEESQMLSMSVILLIAHVIFAAVGCWILATRLSLTPRRRLMWTLSGALLGIGTLLALIASYPKPFKEPCPKCDKNRRIDLEDCEHCGNAWDPPLDEGIEIIEPMGPIGHAEPVLV